MLERRKEATLGTRIEEVEKLDNDFVDRTETIWADVEKMRKASEARGGGCLYTEIQPLIRPELEDLLGERIDILYPFTIDGEDGTKSTVMRWCQGEVIEVYRDCSMPKVTI